MRFSSRRLLLLGAVLAALAMLMTPAVAGADDDDDDDDGGGGGDAAFCAPPGDLVPGQCSYLGGIFRVDFDASSGPLGENPTGTYRIEVGAFFDEVEVTCLQVTGRRASFGGTVTASNLHPVGSGIAVTVLDSPVAPDLSSGSGTALPAGPAANTPDCGDLFEPTLAVEGDIVVQDNTAGGACPPGDDDDGDGLTNNNESLFSTLLGNPDSDLDGTRDGDDDGNGNGEDDEDEDDDEDDGCPDEDSDDDGEDDEDEDDDDD